jgi:hypothetical protein
MQLIEDEEILGIKSNGSFEIIPPAQPTYLSPAKLEFRTKIPLFIKAPIIARVMVVRSFEELVSGGNFDIGYLGPRSGSSPHKDRYGVGFRIAEMVILRGLIGNSQEIIDFPESLVLGLWS